VDRQRGPGARDAAPGCHGSLDQGQTHVRTRVAVATGFRLVIFPISTLLMATAAMRSVLAEIRAKGSRIDVLGSMLRFEGFLDFIGIAEIRELEQVFADESA
jgi:2-methylisocitrate lyase-like PEP mutase family enzyme